MAVLELFNTPLYSDASLVSYYRLENVNDTKGFKNLINTGSVAFNTAKFNNGADCSTVGGRYLEASSFALGSGNFSLVCWFKCNTATPSTSGGAIMYNQNASSITKILIDYLTVSGVKTLTFNKIRQAISNDNIAYAIDLGTSSFYHLAFTYNGTNLVAYVNGVSVGSTASTSGNGTGSITDGFRIGNYVDFDVPGMGITDDAAVFSRALTASEVSSLYTGNFTNSTAMMAFF